MDIVLASVISETYHTQSLEFFRENYAGNTDASFYFADMSKVAEYFTFN